MGGGLLGIYIKKKIIFFFKTWQKMVTKLGQFTKLGHFSFLNCPNLVTIFCQVLKMEIIFFDIPSNPLLIAVRNSLTNNFFPKNGCFCIFSTKKWQVYVGISILVIPDHMNIATVWKNRPTGRFLEKLHPMAHTDTQTDEHGNSVTESAHLGRFNENIKSPPPKKSKRQQCNFKFLLFAK